MSAYDSCLHVCKKAHRYTLTLLCFFVAGIHAMAQDCSVLKTLSADMYAKLISYDTTLPKTEKLTADYLAAYKKYKATLFALIRGDHDNVFKTGAQLILRDETVNYMIEMKKAGNDQEAYREFLFSKKTLSDSIVFYGPYRYDVVCSVGNGMQMAIREDDYREKNASFYSMGVDLAYNTGHPAEGAKYFIYLHDNNLFNAWHTRLNHSAETVFKDRYAADIVDDTCFFAALHFLETYKDRNFLQHFNTKDKANALSVVTDKRFLKMNAPTLQNADDNKYYEHYPTLYMKLYSAVQADTINFFEDDGKPLLKYLLRVANGYKKQIQFDDFYSAFIARGHGDFMKHAQNILEGNDTELQALLADFLYNYRLFNTDIAALAGAFYMKGGNERMAKKSIKDLSKRELEFYRGLSYLHLP